MTTIFNQQTIKGNGLQDRIQVALKEED